jgi:cytosine/adenosine deaminase-related metal-dependent hydrolase
MASSIAALWRTVVSPSHLGKDSPAARAGEIPDLCGWKRWVVRCEVSLCDSPIDRCAETIISGAHCATTPHAISELSLVIDGGRIARMETPALRGGITNSHCVEIGLQGFLLMPGLVNAHDHLEFSLFPRLGSPPYQNYVEWGEDIHSKCAADIALIRSVPKDVRAWWGGIRNLLCGVTTVCHHNPFLAEYERLDFPVRVLREYGWAHSLALGGDLGAQRSATPPGCAFIVHACEGVDTLASEELWTLDRMGLLDADAVLVHGLAIDAQGAKRICMCGTSLIVCPSSNYFLFGRVPDVSLFPTTEQIALGSDSPLTAVGDLLDEIRFAAKACHIIPEDLYQMVTTRPVEILKLKNGEGTIREAGVADLIAVRGTDSAAADRLHQLSAKDVELVMIGGSVQLASNLIFDKLPRELRLGMEPLSVDGTIRWLRAPVKDLLRRTEKVLGQGKVNLSGRKLKIPCPTEIESAA